VKSNQAKRVKLLAAPIGGSAVVTMGALSIALSEGQDGPVNYVAGSTMTVGGTSTQTTPATILATSFAKPASHTIQNNSRLWRASLPSHTSAKPRVSAGASVNTTDLKIQAYHWAT
jgi:hypothetical protein